MRIMTFNLRFQNPLDGPNQWKFRKELVLETIWAYQPDLLAAQEVTIPQLDYLAANLTGYEPFIKHRNIDLTCQYPTIFFRSQTIVAGAGNEFWLSETPEVHRSKSWESAFPRMVTYGSFREVDRDLWFCFADTHLDHVSALARQKAATMLREFFLQLNQPAILAGDFNDHPQSSVHRVLARGDSPFRDSWEVLGHFEEGVSTQHKFDGEFFGGRIDWILITEPFRLKAAEIITYNQAKQYPSDHFPYYVEVNY
ncbi:endonuclease/exonuclease/phosphatase family protein [Desulfobacca acetoxidans]|uniref:Endonuclease/exonuclease/phosphatase n=1 Tax=Desulfobacca acetoxidans (strain ATCC 700848 / DSM 11109 / ASRB2) TaxID=880072 RepID=F2NDL3_DESAR|nr:endonuclease/exonuclease/phosphatase family protein [Desulfobacca acetoxidans]AEB10289.1 Endonuclease/exonuclease/phosphatase [Desulfobacca acetoxidans DSM 11109]